MTWTTDHFAVITTIFLLYPLLYHCFYGVSFKRKEFLLLLSDDGIIEYFNTFHRRIIDPGFANTELINLYNRQFGKKFYIFPVLFFILVVFLLSSWCLSSIFPTLTITQLGPSIPLTRITVAAIAGAYMWVGWDFIDRMRRKDFSPGTVLRASFRFIIAAPVGYAISQLLTDSAGVPVAFLLGAVPTGKLFPLMRVMLARSAKTEVLGSGNVSDLEKLQCIGGSHADRFREEGLTTILQLAYVDPIELTMRTNYSFSYVADCVSQALAWIYLEDNLALARKYSLRGAYEINYIMDPYYQDEEPDLKDKAEKVLDCLSTELKLQPEALRWTLETIAEDPYSLFICHVWGDELDPTI